jgi:colanic acid biosynthesis glycosyl transferase WcaI
MREHQPRVTFIGLNYAPEPTGIAPYTAGLASGLAQLGIGVKVITAYPHYPAWKIARGYAGRTIREQLNGVMLTRVRPYMPSNPAGLRRMAVEIWFGIRSTFAVWGRPDVVILVSPALFAVLIAVVRARLSPRRPRVIIWVQDLYSLGVTETGVLGSVGARVMTSIEAKTLGAADVVVSIHDRFKKYIVNSLGVAPHSVEVVRNWTHITPVESNRAEYRSKFSWGDEIVVLHAGNMGAKQALENVVTAAKLADSAKARIRFVLLGDGNQRESLVELGTSVDRLDFMGSLSDSDFQGAMAAADILLVNEKPGVTEMAVPSKLTSYFAAARPVIVATDAGSITAEEIETTNAGVRVDAGNPQALLDAALALGSDAKLCRFYGENGAAFQLRVLSPDGAISHYAEIIKSLAGKRGL